jgi:hypothetical protein
MKAILSSLVGWEWALVFTEQPQFSNFGCINTIQGFFKEQIWGPLCESEAGLKIHISNKLPGDAASAQGTTLV